MLIICELKLYDMTCLCYIKLQHMILHGIIPYHSIRPDITCIYIYTHNNNTNTNNDNNNDNDSQYISIV